MATVQGPDGKVISFPDSMSDAQISQTMHHIYGGGPAPAPKAASEPSPWVKWPAVLGTAAVHGLDLGLGSVGDIDELGNKYLPSWMTRDLITGKPGGQIAPTSSQIEGVTNKLGLTGTAIGQPKTAAQGVTAGIVSGAAAAAPLIASGDPLGVLTVGGAAGGASGLTSELMPNSPLVSTTAGLVTGLATNSLASDARNLMALRNAERAAAAAKSGLAAAKDARTTGNEALYNQTAAQIATAKQQAAAAKASLTPHLPPYEGIAAGFGHQQTLQEAGEDLQASGRKWLTEEMPKRQDAAWAPVDKLIPPTAEIELPEYAGTLSAITQKGERLGADLRSPLFDKLNSRLKAALTPQEAIPGEGEPQIVPLTWTDARQLRSLLGDALADTQTVKPIHQQDLNNLYRALTHDMAAKAGSISPQAGQAFNNANAASQKLFDFAEGPLAKVVRGKKPDPVDPLPEAVARRLLTAGRTGATDLTALRAELPDAVDGLSAAFFRQQGKAWSALSPEAKMALAPKSYATIDQQIGKHEQDLAAFNLAHKAIAGGLADARGAAAAKARGTRVQLQSNQRNAQRSLDKANEQYEAAKNARGKVGVNMLGGILGGNVGNELAISALHALGVPGSEWLHGAWGGLLGAAAPWALHSAARMVKQPRGPLSALQGARGGAAATTHGVGSR